VRPVHTTTTMYTMPIGLLSRRVATYERDKLARGELLRTTKDISRCTDVYN